MAEQLYNAVFIGSIYALFALGFALVFSVLDILNLAHPTVFMLGAFIALFVIGTLGLPWFVALPIAVLVTGLFGIALDRVAFAPLRRRRAPALSSMISSLAVTLIVTFSAAPSWDAICGHSPRIRAPRGSSASTSTARSRPRSSYLQRSAALPASSSPLPTTRSIPGWACRSSCGPSR